MIKYKVYIQLFQNLLPEYSPNILEVILSNLQNNPKRQLFLGVTRWELRGEGGEGGDREEGEEGYLLTEDISTLSSSMAPAEREDLGIDEFD